MTNIKLEVGQVWKSRKDNGSTYEVLKTFHCIDGFEWLCYFYKNGNNNDTSCNCRLISTFTRNRTLITNTDGTPYTPPKKYKELTPAEAMRLLADAGECIDAEFTDISNSWTPSKLIGTSYIDFSFVDQDEAVWKRCRIEVTND